MSSPKQPSAEELETFEAVRAVVKQVLTVFEATATTPEIRKYASWAIISALRRYDDEGRGPKSDP